MSTGTAGVSPLAQDFPMFAYLRPPAGGTAQNPQLAQLNMAMAQAGLGGSTGFSEQWSFGDVVNWGKKAVETGKTIYDAGKSLGLFSDGPEGQIEAQFLDTFLRSQVEELIKKLHDYVNRYGNLVECVPLVTKCVQQFGAGQYGSALATGYQAYNCISSKI